MMRRIMSAAATLAVCGVGGTACAQQASSAPTSSETLVVATASVLYDSNIAKTDREIAAERGLVLADEVYTPAVNFTLARQVGAEIIYVQGFASYIYHEHDSLLNRQSIDVDGGVSARFARCQEVADGSFSSVQSDLAELTQVRVANVVDSSVAGLSVSCGGSIGLAPQATITESWKDNSSGSFAANNLSTFSATGALAYRSPALGSIAVFGTYSRTTFPNYLLALTSNSDMSTSSSPATPSTDGNYGYALYVAGVSLDRHLGGRIEGIASISYTDLEPNNSASQPFRGISYSLDAVYHLNPRVDLHVTASRAAVPSGQVGAEYSIKETYEADVSYAMGPRIVWQLTASDSSHNYGGVAGALAAGGFLPVVIAQSTAYDVMATVTYKLNRRFSVSLNGGDEERRANLVQYNYSSTRIGLTITGTY